MAGPSCASPARAPATQSEHSPAQCMCPPRGSGGQTCPRSCRTRHSGSSAAGGSGCRSRGRWQAMGGSTCERARPAALQRAGDRRSSKSGRVGAASRRSAASPAPQHAGRLSTRPVPPCTAPACGAVLGGHRVSVDLVVLGGRQHPAVGGEQAEVGLGGHRTQQGRWGSTGCVGSCRVASRRLRGARTRTPRLRWAGSAARSPGLSARSAPAWRWRSPS